MRSQPQPTKVVLCQSFRQKTMYLGGAEPDMERYNPSSSAHCWCVRTLAVFGPDDRRVDPDECCAGRSCYEPY